MCVQPEGPDCLGAAAAAKQRAVKFQHKFKSEVRMQRLSTVLYGIRSDLYHYICPPLLLTIMWIKVILVIVFCGNYHGTIVHRILRLLSHTGESLMRLVNKKFAVMEGLDLVACF